MNPALIRAARGLVGWQQSDLAAAAGLSLSAVNKFERKLGPVRTVTLQAMIGALEDAGVEFLPNGAIRLTDDVQEILRFSGDSFIADMNKTMFSAVRTTGQDIYTCSTDEALWFAPGMREASEAYYLWRKRMGVKEFYLVPDSNTVFESPRSQYRILPSAMIGKISYVIYADRLALVSWRKKQVVILRGKHLVDPFREQFKFLWRLGRKP